MLTILLVGIALLGILAAWSLVFYNFLKRWKSWKIVLPLGLVLLIGGLAPIGVDYLGERAREQELKVSLARFSDYYQEEIPGLTLSNILGFPTTKGYFFTRPDGEAYLALLLDGATWLEVQLPDPEASIPGEGG